FLRSLPCRPLASASFEHSSEAAVRGFSALAAGAAAGAGVWVCAKAEPASRSDAASARPAVREEVVIMEAPPENRERKATSRLDDEPLMNGAGPQPHQRRLYFNLREWNARGGSAKLSTPFSKSPRAIIKEDH